MTTSLTLTHSQDSEENYNRFFEEPEIKRSWLENLVDRLVPVDKYTAAMMNEKRAGIAAIRELLEADAYRIRQEAAQAAAKVQAELDIKKAEADGITKVKAAEARAIDAVTTRENNAAQAIIDKEQAAERAEANRLAKVREAGEALLAQFTAKLYVKNGDEDGCMIIVSVGENKNKTKRGIVKWQFINSKTAPRTMTEPLQNFFRASSVYTNVVLPYVHNIIELEQIREANYTTKSAAGVLQAWIEFPLHKGD